MRHFTAPVASNILLCEGIYELTFAWEPGMVPPLPGQFCTIRVSSATSPLLRRPFAFSGFDRVKRSVSIVYKKCGPATEIMAGKVGGEALDVIGPLGNSFAQCALGKTNLLIAGGTGFGPVFFLKHYLMELNKPSRMILGCKTSAQLPQSAHLNSPTAFVCTEDGSEGFMGTTVDYLKSLQKEQLDQATLFCCGPTPMLKACYDFAATRGLQCHVSMEQYMACGVGACMGCVVKVHGDNPFARVCTEGPVFNGAVIAWT
jgi:dihydroorotate dehydrogenase electron transfer subunit